MKPSILIFAGSNRQDSINKKLAQIATQTAEQLGFKASFIDLKDYPMPLYDGDIEQNQGIPETAHKLEALIKTHDAIIIASPEYNGAFTPLLKNTIDWMSRINMMFLQSKVIGLMSASPSPSGGARSLALVRNWFENMRLNPTSESYSLAEAMNAFENDKLKEAQQAKLEQFLLHVAQTVEEQSLVSA